MTLMSLHSSAYVQRIVAPLILKPKKKTSVQRGNSTDNFAMPLDTIPPNMPVIRVNTIIDEAPKDPKTTVNKKTPKNYKHETHHLELEKSRCIHPFDEIKFNKCCFAKRKSKENSEKETTRPHTEK